MESGQGPRAAAGPVRVTWPRQRSHIQNSSQCEEAGEGDISCENDPGDEDAELGESILTWTMK